MSNLDRAVPHILRREKRLNTSKFVGSPLDRKSAQYRSSCGSDFPPSNLDRGRVIGSDGFRSKHRRIAISSSHRGRSPTPSPTMKLQPTSTPILIGAWSRDDDFAIHPVGSKPKRTVICPETETRPFLIPGHSYLFKIADGWKAQQLWSEVIAYQIGCLVGLPEPPTYEPAYPRLVGHSVTCLLSMRSKRSAQPALNRSFDCHVGLSEWWC